MKQTKHPLFAALLVALLLTSGSSQLAEADEVTIEVQGMVCSFCAQGIEKKLKKEAAVIEDTIVVDLDKKQVNLEVKEGSAISDAKLQQIIKSSGMNVKQIVRKKPAAPTRDASEEAKP